MTPELVVSLRKIIAIAPSTHDWWLIGSAAAHLSGAVIDPADVDLCGSKSTIDNMLLSLNETAGPGSQSDRFRSQPFHSLTVEGGLTIEFMGDLQVCREGVWQTLTISTRVPVDTGFGIVYVPSLAEQITTFELFGRDKDLKKAALLRALA